VTAKVRGRQTEMSDKKITMWTHNYTVLIVMNFIAYLGQNSLNTLIQVKAGVMQLDPSITGTILGLASGAALVIRPFGGSVIDSANKKHLLLFCETMYTIAVFGYAFAGSVPSIMLFRIIFGIGMGFCGALCMTMAADSVPKEKVSSAVGVFAVIGTVATAIGPVISLEINKRFGIKVAFLVCGVFSLTGLLIGFLLKYPKERKKINVSIKGAFTMSAMVPSVMCVFMLLSSATVMSFIVTYTNYKNIEGVSMFYIINAAVMLLFRPVLNRITEKRGVSVTIIPGLIVFAIFLIFMSGIKSTAALYFAAVLYSLGYGTLNPGLQALAIKHTPVERRGAGTNTYYLGYDMGLTIGPMVAGKVAELFGYEKMYVILIFPLICIALMLFVWKKKSSEPLG